MPQRGGRTAFGAGADRGGGFADADGRGGAAASGGWGRARREGGWGLVGCRFREAFADILSGGYQRWRCACFATVGRWFDWRDAVGTSDNCKDQARAAARRGFAAAGNRDGAFGGRRFARRGE